MSNVIQDKLIQDKRDCTGCAACANICPKQCIELVKDSEGFYYPHIKAENCVKCGLCISSCHQKQEKENNSEEIAPEVYAAYTRDNSTLHNSSSGGIFKEIATFIISQGGVVYGAAFADTCTVKHIAVETLEDIRLLQGSKYLQSDVGNVYSLVKQNLTKGRPVLFTGTPCQVAGLKKYLGREHDGLFTLDIICHGVPSPLVWQKYINYIEKRAGDKINKVNFRDKKHGWKKFSVSITFNNGTQYSKVFNEDLFMKGFLSDIYLRPACYNCSYKTTSRNSDFTLADFWGIQNVCSEMDNENGTSLCLLNTEKSKKVWESIKSGIVYKKVNLYEALKYNSAAVHSSKEPKTRGRFFELLETCDFDIALKKTLPKQRIYQKVIRKIKRIFKSFYT